MNAFRIAVLASLLLAMTLATGASAQAGPVSNNPVGVRPISLSGPRFGVTVLSGGIQDRVAEFTGQRPGPVVTQFGWQWETRFFSVEGGPTGVSEWILLVGGLEQSLFLPSLTWIMGIRGPNGGEFGVGPNVTPAGAALAVGGGFTIQSGPIYFPINLAVVPSKDGLRVSALAGFNMRQVKNASASRAP